MAEPRKHPEKDKGANSKTGVASGETPSTDATKRPDRPVDEEDVFGGAERTHKGERVESPGTKP